MARYQRLDPDGPDGVVVSAKLGVRDNQRVIDLANEAGVGKSEYIRGLALGALGQAGDDDDDDE